jgi:hypothetical protein
MTEELDPRIVSDVKDVVKDTLRFYRNQVKLNEVVGIEHYKPTHAQTSEGIKLNLHEEEDRIFARAMVMMKDKFFDTYNQEITNDYAKIGARYLLMPEIEFYRNCKECNFDLFALKNIYPHVSYKMIAYRIADENRCATTQWDNGQIRRLYKNNDVNVNNLTHRDLDRVAREALKAQEGTYTFQPNDFFRMTGWKVGENMVQILCFWEDY